MSDENKFTAELGCGVSYIHAVLKDRRLQLYDSSTKADFSFWYTPAFRISEEQRKTKQYEILISEFITQED